MESAFNKMINNTSVSDITNLEKIKILQTIQTVIKSNEELNSIETINIIKKNNKEINQLIKNVKDEIIQLLKQIKEFDNDRQLEIIAEVKKEIIKLEPTLIINMIFKSEYKKILKILDNAERYILIKYIENHRNSISNSLYGTKINENGEIKKKGKSLPQFNNKFFRQLQNSPLTLGSLSGLGKSLSKKMKPSFAIYDEFIKSSNNSKNKNRIQKTNKLKKKIKRLKSHPNKLKKKIKRLKSHPNKLKKN